MGLKRGMNRYLLTRYFSVIFGIVRSMEAREGHPLGEGTVCYLPGHPGSLRIGTPVSQDGESCWRRSGMSWESGGISKPSKHLKS